MQSQFAAPMMESMQNVAQQPLSRMFPGAPPEALDLLARLLAFNPDARCCLCLLKREREAGASDS